MSIGRMVAGVLAWTGLVVVVGVPAADLAWSKIVPGPSAQVVETSQPTQQTMPPGAGSAKKPVAASAETEAPVAPLPATPVTTKGPAANTAAVAPLPAVTRARAPTIASVPATTASVSPPPAIDVADEPTAGTAASANSNALDHYLAGGKKLPDYLTPADPAPTAPAPVAASTSTAAASQAPASAAPKPVVVAPAVAPTTAVASDEAAAPTPAPRPKPPAHAVTAADLKDWKSGSLEDYLRQHGLLTNGSDGTGN